jgi:hypothetical protein
VRAGGGGAAERLAAGVPDKDARENGPGARHAVIGLVLAGVAAAAVLLRTTRRGRRGTE